MTRFVRRTALAGRLIRLVAVVLMAWGACGRAWADADPFAWLEDVSAPRSMAWVKAQNAASLGQLHADPRFAGFEQTALSLAQDPDRIPMPTLIGGMVYNVWQDAGHVQGIWRRTTIADYQSANPHWQTVLDLDALSAAEHRQWVFQGATCWQPEDRRCLVFLSDTGEDAMVAREFDLASRSFVAGGFALPRAKLVAEWMDADDLLVGTDWGPGSLTASGYPYQLRKWHRGQKLSAATPYFTAGRQDVGVRLDGFVDGQGHHALVIDDELDFFHSRRMLAGPGGVRELPLPQQGEVVGLLNDRLVVQANEAWGDLPAGALGALNLADPASPPAPVFVPGPRQAVDSAVTTRDAVVAVVLDNVQGRAMVLTPPRRAGDAYRARSLALPEDQAVVIRASSTRDDRVFLSVTGFLNPTALFLADAADDAGPAGVPRRIKALPARFDTSGLAVRQLQARSSDGTMIPYFVVGRRDLPTDGSNPTLLTAYGGFQVSEVPNYDPTLGRLWLDRGGVFVLANIRGGGEFGPAWHEAGLKTHRQRIYDDFAAVARDLMTRRITDPAHLGISGRSNGGLLMGVEFTQHPELFHAVIIGVPLLDMLHFEQIAAGASWVGEYGSVSVPAQKAFLARISPYANLHADVTYPEPFIFTSTHDDRVGPQHARKFAARLHALGKLYLYYEAIEGGHPGSGANLHEAAELAALEFTYLTEKLMAAPDRNGAH